ncbi:diaminopimelate epimerase [Actinoplanes derwentensis]|uniref:Diaminopimelate epimerase n=1 Tax=Actinoplanes derwentensis TaxID=113562 RepID=A0A1H2D5C2_9ACTN|nr:diaminopimelate epimerase [Actinoplanes derwentensis]GID85311.1 diaminopimelate epimerase [Actinoplanes derwentensis]SDT77958.1 diaminopimelate epimerase [Actinoplanes derwentensis]
MRFTKGHGTGNDFVILPDPDGELTLTPRLVAALCDRRKGIGGDGVIRVVRSAKHPEAAAFAGEAEWFMDYHNSDGSIAEMCGNGLRVFVRYLLVNGLAVAGPSGLPVATRAGVLVAEIGDGTIRASMTTPRLYAGSTATLGHLTLTGVAVDCGNPHLVCGLHDGVALSALDLAKAPLHDAVAFPHGVNVEFVEQAEPLHGRDQHVRMRVHERGSGETQSCGTGALAVGAVALRDAGLTTGSVAVDVLGGRLVVTADADGVWWLEGPAVLVADGEVDPEAVL